MIPHLVWLKEVDFVPLTYAGDVYGLSSRAQSVQLVLGYIGHNLALLRCRWRWPRWRWRWLAGAMLHAAGAVARAWSRGANAA
jgi:hypothetical protein